jgi:hypothetical protein
MSQRVTHVDVEVAHGPLSKQNLRSKESI